MQRSKRKRFDQLDENEDQATQNDKQEDWRGRKDVTEQTCDSTLPSSTSACPCRDDDQTEPECDADVIQHADVLAPDAPEVAKTDSQVSQASDSHMPGFAQEEQQTIAALPATSVMSNSNNDGDYDCSVLIPSPSVLAHSNTDIGSQESPEPEPMMPSPSPAAEGTHNDGDAAAGPVIEPEDLSGGSSCEDESGSSPSFVDDCSDCRHVGRCNACGKEIRMRKVTLKYIANCWCGGGSRPRPMPPI